MSKRINKAKTSLRHLQRSIRRIANTPADPARVSTARLNNWADEIGYVLQQLREVDRE